MLKTLGIRQFYQGDKGMKQTPQKSILCSLILLLLTTPPVIYAKHLPFDVDGTATNNNENNVRNRNFKPTLSFFTIKDEPIEFPFFLSFGSGISFSKQAKIFANPVVWDPAFEGYNGKLHQTAQYAVGFGYQFTQLISLNIEGTYRPSFKYRKFQTSSANGTPLATSQKTRKFDLSNRSLMANVTLSGQGINFYTHLGSNAILQPFIGAGIGISNNQTSNFHSVLTSQNIAGFGLKDISVMGNDIKNKTNFAWQLEGGFEMLYCQKLGIELGYRYFNSGKFKTTDHIIPGAVPFLPAPYAIGGVQTFPWIGKLMTHELFVKLKYRFY